MTGGPGLRVLAVDDVTPALEELRRMLMESLEVAAVAVAADPISALRLIQAGPLDVVFLDISMPQLTGMELASLLNRMTDPPAVVFVTAYEEHAIRAFEANAVNYLMKPVDEDKLADTIDRVRSRMTEKRSAEEAEKLKDVLAEVAPEAMEQMPAEEETAARYEKLINVKDRGQIFRVDVDTIEHIEAAGDYMCIYTGDNSLILRETMKDLERRLDPRVFQRVHRSTIVNLDQVRQVKPHTNGECFLVLGSGAQVKVSRSYRDVVARFVH